MGFVNDKDISAVLDLLPVDAQYYFTNAHIPRALPHAELRAMAKEKNLNGESYDDVNEAITTAKNRANKNDVIIVCGSFFILAEVKN
jgi:dihydrofolate synthase/folylpolyglutamate synthase